MHRTDGFTAAYCGDPGCPSATGGPAVGRVGPALAATVRTCPHGVLVRASCLHGGDCSGTAAGGCVVVQPCDAERRPVGGAVLAGPLHEDADVADLCSWLTDGLPDGVPLPAHLRPMHLGAGADHR